MNEDTTLMTDQATTTTEGADTSTQTEQGATGAPGDGQQQQPAGDQPASTQESQPAEGEGEKEDTPEGAPEKYEFKAPEGKEFDAEVLGQFEEIARELNLSQDAAQRILDKMAPTIAARQEAQVKAISQQWVEASKSDPEFGGEGLSANLAHAKKAMDTFATDELRKLLNDSHLGNNPEVIRLFVRVGKAIGEDGFVRSGAGVTPARDPRRLYPNSNMN